MRHQKQERSSHETGRFDRFSEEWSRRAFLKGLGGATAFAAFMASACTPAPAAQPSASTPGAGVSPVKGGKMTEGNSLPVIEFNPVNRTNTPHNINVPLVLECLYAASAMGTIESRLASAAPTISSDGLTYTVPLRKNMTWSDGQPITTDDVLFTFALMLDAQYSAITSAWRADFKQRVANISSNDQGSVIFQLKTSDAPFLSRLTNIDIAPKHILGSLSADDIQASFTEPPKVSSGVFTVVDWKRGDYVQFARNDRFFDGPSYLDSYLYKVVPTTDGLMNQLQTGEIDVARIPSPGIFDQLKSMPNMGALFIPATFVHGHAYNLDPARPSSAIFSSKAVRQALWYALDRDSMVTGIFFKYANVQDSALIPQSWAYSDTQPRYTYDPKKAAALLDGDGWTLGTSGVREKNGIPLKFEFLTATGTPEIPLMATVMQQNWKQIGADVTVLPLPQPDWIARTNVTHDFDVGYGGASASPLDPDLSGSLHSRNVGSGNSNITHYMNAEVDKLLDQAASTPDMAVRKMAYARIQDILLDEVPVAPTLIQQYAWAYNRRVQGMGDGDVGVYNIITQRIGMNKVFVTS